MLLSPAAGFAGGAVSAVDRNGDAVGSSFDLGTGKQVATLWPGTGTAPQAAGTDLDTLLPPNSGITLYEAIAINANGQIIAYGSAGGRNEYVELSTGQSISGMLTDSAGHPVPGGHVHITGTDNHGSPVDKQAMTDVDGNYTVALDPGNYTVAAVNPSDDTLGRYVGSTCSGTLEQPSCRIMLNAGDQASANFKLEKLVVNSTATDYDPQASLDQGVCDTTPAQAAATCTLPAAIEVLNKLGGGTITFDIPGARRPTIIVDAHGSLPDLTAPIVVDGSTQPGAHTVGLTSRDSFVVTAVNIRSHNVTSRE